MQTQLGSTVECTSISIPPHLFPPLIIENNLASRAESSSKHDLPHYPKLQQCTTFLVTNAFPAEPFGMDSFGAVHPGKWTQALA